MKPGDKVIDPAGREGTVEEVEWHGVTINWPKAFGWFRGHTVYYRNRELDEYGITKLEGVTT